MVRFIIKEYNSHTHPHPHLHSTMVRFIIERFYAVGKTYDTIYIPLWLDLLLKSAR